MYNGRNRKSPLSVSQAGCQRFPNQQEPERTRPLHDKGFHLGASQRASDGLRTFQIFTEARRCYP